MVSILAFIGLCSSYIINGRGIVEICWWHIYLICHDRLSGTRSITKIVSYWYSHLLQELWEEEHQVNPVNSIRFHYFHIWCYSEYGTIAFVVLFLTAVFVYTIVTEFIGESESTRIRRHRGTAHDRATTGNGIQNEHINRRTTVGRHLWGGVRNNVSYCHIRDWFYQVWWRL